MVWKRKYPNNRFVLNGKTNGIWKSYYESGKIYRKFNYKEGKLIDNFFIECDEFGVCQKLFYEDFSNKENINKWEIGSYDWGKIFCKLSGLSCKSYTKNGIATSINVPINSVDNFTIETIVDFRSGIKNMGHGLIWVLRIGKIIFIL